MSHDIDPRIAKALERLAPAREPATLALERDVVLRTATPGATTSGRRARPLMFAVALLLAFGALAVGSALGLGFGDLYVFQRDDAPIRSADDAKTFLGERDQGFQNDSGLNAEEVAGTHEIYTFDGQLSNFAAGLSVYRTDLAKGGFCLTFANATSCSPEGPSKEEPLKGIGFDPDASHGGEPFVLVSIKAPDVTAVSYTCAGATYRATISGDVVVFISPDSSLAAEGCVANSTMKSGDVVSRGV